MNRGHSGFTIWELMMSLAVAGVVLGLGVPSFMEFQRTNAMAAAVNELVTATLLARTEAVKRQVPVTLCATSDPLAAAPECDLDAQSGDFIVFVDENDDGDSTDATDGNAEVDDAELVLFRREAPGGTIEITSDSGYVAYGPSGFPRQPTAQAKPPASVVLLCDDRGNNSSTAGSSTARVVRIEATGRGLVLQGTADVSAAVADIAGADCS